MNRIAGGKKRQDKMIQLNTSCILQVHLNYPNYHLLLFNRCADNIHALCPSRDFAPSPIVLAETMIIPQAKAEYEDLVFEKVGKEEFIAIVVDRRLSNQGLSVGDLYRFWLSFLQEGKEVTVFYDRFEVVEG
jgi:hypothetical protein